MCHESIQILQYATTSSGRTCHLYDGAYYLVNDDGSLYDRLRHIECGVSSCSSHLSTHPQFRCGGADVGILIYGRRGDHTWFQMERYPIWSIGHPITYLYYRIFGINTGPIGTSRYTEHEPIRITPH